MLIREIACAALHAIPVLGCSGLPCYVVSLICFKRYELVMIDVSLLSMLFVSKLVSKLVS